MVLSEQKLSSVRLGKEDSESSNLNGADKELQEVAKQFRLVENANDKLKIKNEIMNMSEERIKKECDIFFQKNIDTFAGQCDVEDLIQEAKILLYKKIDFWQPKLLQLRNGQWVESSFSYWFFKVILFRKLLAMVDYYRRRKTLSLIEDDRKDKETPSTLGVSIREFEFSSNQNNHEDILINHDLTQKAGEILFNKNSPYDVFDSLIFLLYYGPLNNGILFNFWKEKFKDLQKDDLPKPLQKYYNKIMEFIHGDETLNRHGLNYEEVGAIFGITKQAVAFRVKKIIKGLKSELKN
ncbi:MAG: hypothetical protein COU31_00305 [Candidatus Magasanikbacteria bacterium CG10_big_fil_rev_8_21_14_0_10_40_10]|uniref:Uncharacterized protein n=1 Tax=Candidatus Magasanikbacteria bacterium CG10_big_fil_rev_8_21_14_0_10_40_10 TaxID=1974648 RepID=A0A2M6W559_9BACT|nr:MAG: hypothetical protein COU31_00305 [Candidatus Magasanikbacteria bacterium CG10_big_fil_rev_8_21_14_0_10_40_10]